VIFRRCLCFQKKGLRHLSEAALQQEPEVVMAHSALMKLLRLKT